MSWNVLKFGGTSVGTPEAMAQAARITQERYESGAAVAVVVSALSGVTDQLDALAREDHDDLSILAGLAALWDRHLKQLSVLSGPGLRRSEAEACLRSVFLSLAHSWFHHSPRERREPRFLANWLAQGETAASILFETALTGLGVPALRLDAGELLVLHGEPLDAHPDLKGTRERVWQVLGKASRRVAVIPGFQGRLQDGSRALLGRGGSDTSATLLAWALAAERCEIFSDVEGVAPTDPRKNPDTAFFPKLTYDQAEALAALGAKVLHVKSLAPARKGRIPIRVASTFRPELPGTWIVEDPSPRPPRAARIPYLVGAWA